MLYPHSLLKVGKLFGWDFHRCTKCRDYFWVRRANVISVPEDCPFE